jgi:hypothetical protein
MCKKKCWMKKARKKKKMKKSHMGACGTGSAVAPSDRAPNWFCDLWARCCWKLGIDTWPRPGEGWSLLDRHWVSDICGARIVIVQVTLHIRAPFRCPILSYTTIKKRLVYWHPLSIPHTTQWWYRAPKKASYIISRFGIVFDYLLNQMPDRFIWKWSST